MKSRRSPRVCFNIKFFLRVTAGGWDSGIPHHRSGGLPGGQLGFLELADMKMIVYFVLSVG